MFFGIENNYAWDVHREIFNFLKILLIIKNIYMLMLIDLYYFVFNFDFTMIRNAGLTKQYLDFCI